MMAAFVPGIAMLSYHDHNLIHICHSQSQYSIEWVLNTLPKYVVYYIIMYLHSNNLLKVADANQQCIM